MTFKGGSLAVEEARSRTMTQVTGAIVDALCRAQSAEDSPSIRLDAVAVLTVVESAMRSQLAVDPTFRELGPRRFHDEVTRICADIVNRGPSTGTA